MECYLKILTILRNEHVAGGRLEFEDILYVILILLEPVHVVQRGGIILILLLLHTWLREDLLHLPEALLRFCDGLHLLRGRLHWLGLVGGGNGRLRGRVGCLLRQSLCLGDQISALHGGLP